MTSSTFFDSIKRSYADVDIGSDQKIDTSQFLEACESLVTLFDVFGSSAFGVVQRDMSGNIKKLRDRQLATPLKSDTVQSLIDNEQADKKDTATVGLLWLLRGLKFTSAALRRNVQNSAEELSTSFTEAYGVTLRQYHGMLVRPIFALAMKSTPYRADFYKKLGSDQKKVMEQAHQWLAALEKQVGILEKFYAKGGYGKV